MPSLATSVIAYFARSGAGSPSTALDDLVIGGDRSRVSSDCPLSGQLPRRRRSEQRRNGKQPESLLSSCSLRCPAMPRYPRRCAIICCIMPAISADFFSFA